MSSFFLPPKRSSNDRKRKRTSKEKPERAKKEKLKKTNKALQDEEIASDSDIEREERRPNRVKVVTEEEEVEEETAPEKRLRLAKQYIAQVEEEELNMKDNIELDHDAIAHRLKEDVLKEAGKLQRKVADNLSAPDSDSIQFLRGHQLTVTCIALTSDDHFAYSADKDGCIIKWDLENATKVHVFKSQKRRQKATRREKVKGRTGEVLNGGIVGHVGCVLALAVSTDDTYLASGGKDGAIHVWSVESNNHIHTFTGHRDSISGLAFQRGTHELFSCSFDRTVKIWNLDEMSYVETLFGHQDGVGAIDCLQRERPVTAGTNDRSVRLWKVVQESQLVFTGHKASIDCVRLINEEHFITGSQDGSIAVWAVVKKKPLVKQFHYDSISKEEEGEGEKGGALREHKTDEDKKGIGDGWVTAVAAYPNSDLVASGSSNGYVVLWKCGSDFRSLDCQFTVTLRGFVNCLQFAESGAFLVAAIGQEHRLGRWWRDSSVRNSIALIPLPKTQT